MRKKLMRTMCAAFCAAMFFCDTAVWAAEYEYDDLGRVTKVTYEDKSSVTYAYDANGNIVSVTKTEPLIPQETTAKEPYGTASKPEQETSGGSQEEETKPQPNGGSEHTIPGNTGAVNNTPDGNVTENEIKRPGNNAVRTMKENGNGGTDGMGTEKETVGTGGTLSETENITGDEGSMDTDNAKTGFWQKVWNVVKGFFLWLWSVIKGFFLWIWSLLKQLFQWIFGN